MLRSVAVHESWWEMDTLGDNGDSFGIFQVRRPYHCCLPFMRDSTAFNADYYGGIMRAYYDGKMDWLNNPDVRPDNGRKYKAGRPLGLDRRLGVGPLVHRAERRVRRRGEGPPEGPDLGNGSLVPDEPLSRS